MYIEFDDYPRYTDAISDIFETRINLNLNFCHGYPYSTTKGLFITCINKKKWYIFKICFPEALTVVKCPKIAICNSCEYVDDSRQKSTKFYIPPSKNNIPSQPRFSTNTHS